MGIAGWILFALGVASLVLGLVLGAKDVFVKTNQGGAQAALPTELIKVIGKLLDAPAPKFFCVLGLILVIIGLALNGVEVFGAGGEEALDAVSRS